MDRTIQRRVVIFSDRVESVLAAKVNRFLEDLLPIARDQAKLQFSSTTWESEGVIVFSVLVDFPVVL